MQSISNDDSSQQNSIPPNLCIRALLPNKPETVDAGTVIRIAYKVTPELCRHLADSVTVTFAVKPEPFIPPPPPAPVEPQPGAPNFGFLSAEDMSRRQTGGYQNELSSLQAQWAQTHPRNTFTVRMDLIPDQDPTSGVYQGSVVRYTNSPNQPAFIQPQTIFAGTYHLQAFDVFSTQGPGNPGGIQANEEAEADQLIVIVEKDIPPAYYPPPPPPPSEDVSIT